MKVGLLVSSLVLLLMIFLFPPNTLLAEDLTVAFDGELQFYPDTIVAADAAKDSILEKRISIIGVGDIMLGTNFPNKSYLPPNDGRNILDSVTEILQNATVAFGNLEGVLLTGDGEVKKCKDSTVCYAFKSPDHYVNYIKNAGFDVLSIANNHVGDFGDIGRKNTVRLLDSVAINYAGLTESPFTTFEQDGLTFGFCAFAPNNGTQQLNDYENATNIIKHLDTIADIVIVSFHGGAEGAKYDEITRETEMFLGENRGNPYEFARMAIDAGADIVFGHGPHLTRAVDLYKDRFIAYSLGNFATYGRFNLKENLGIAPIIKVFTNEEGAFLEAEIFATKQLGKGVPVIDKENKAVKELKRLTERDMPETEIIITDEGKIIRRK